MNKCNTQFCSNIAKYLIIKDRVQVKYCLPCIQKIKDTSR